jgi:hypothetical protein
MKAAYHGMSDRKPLKPVRTYLFIFIFITRFFIAFCSKTPQKEPFGKKLGVSQQGKFKKPCRKLLGHTKNKNKIKSFSPPTFLLSRF